MVTQGWQWVQELTPDGHEGICQVDENVLILDCGDVYTSVYLC